MTIERQSIKAIIYGYVKRQDIGGLAEYARAMVDDGVESTSKDAVSIIKEISSRLPHRDYNADIIDESLAAIAFESVGEAYMAGYDECLKGVKDILLDLNEQQ